MNLRGIADKRRAVDLDRELLVISVPPRTTGSAFTQRIPASFKHLYRKDTNEFVGNADRRLAVRFLQMRGHAFDWHVSLVDLLVDSQALRGQHSAG